MNWLRVFLFGVVLWLVPFVVSFVIFPIHDTDRSLFESLITLVGVTGAVVASYLIFRTAHHASLRDGLAVGLAWAAISILLDLPIFLLVFHMGVLNYAEDIALTYLLFPIIAMGIARSAQIGTVSTAAPNRVGVAAAKASPAATSA